MQFPANEEDGDFLTSETSRLSSLFHSDSPSGDVNQALTFTAPKQPKKNDNAQELLKLLHAVVVNAYKLKDGNYLNQGKLGCAILGHHETFSYRLLLYKGKQVQVTVASITPSFLFHVQPHNYTNFYDDKKENWSINFDSEGSLFQFMKQVALAKALSQGKPPTGLVIQDLVYGEGPMLENGDAAEVKYTGWLLSNFVFGQMFDSNMTAESFYRLRLGKSKIIKGWNEGLSGMQKGGKRLLIVPPDYAYGSEGMGNVVPPNSTVIFEIHVVKVKAVHDSSHSPSPVKAPDSVPEKKPDVPPRQSFSQDDNIRLRGASISEQLSQSPKKDKAELISRMAKMGTATLPFQGAVPAQISSDSEPECGSTPFPTYPSENFSMLQSPFPMQNFLGMVPTSMIDSHLPILITEAQNQSTEVRISLSKIIDKVDTILTKVDDMHLRDGSASTSGVPFMEGTVILRNIEKIIQENRHLKQAIETKNCKIESLNEKICGLYQRNQGFFEENSTMLEQKSDFLQSLSAQSQEKFFILEQEKARLQLELSTTSIKLNAIEADVSKCQKIESELRQKLEVAEIEVKTQKKLLKENDNTVNNLKTKLIQLNCQLVELKAVEEENISLALKIKRLELVQSNSQKSDELIEKHKDSNLQEDKEKLQKELEESLQLKNEMQTKYKETLKKHEIFQDKARVLKEKYEQVVNELQHKQVAKSGGTSPEFSAEIKKVMNALYKLLQGKFEPFVTYQGSKILETVLQTIKGLTFHILEKGKKPSGDCSSPPEPSKKENSSKQEQKDSEELSHLELAQQNSIQDEDDFISEKQLKNFVSSNKDNAVVVDSLKGDVILKEISCSKGNVASKEIHISKDEVASKEVSDSKEVVDPTEADTSANKDASELTVSSNTEDIPQTDMSSNAQSTDKIRCTSPEIWKPQPPLFDDDDDDEEEEAEWLK